MPCSLLGSYNRLVKIVRDWPKAEKEGLERGPNFKHNYEVELLCCLSNISYKIHYSNMGWYLWKHKDWANHLLIFPQPFGFCYFAIFFPFFFCSSINNTWILLLGKWSFLIKYNLLDQSRESVSLHFLQFRPIT